MKRKKERYLKEFTQLIQKVRMADYYFPYQNTKTINLWWISGNPVVDLVECNFRTRLKFMKIPLPMLIVLVTELKAREKN